MLGSSVVQTRHRLRDGIQVDGLNCASGWKNSLGPGGPHWSAVCPSLLGAMDLLATLIEHLFALTHIQSGIGYSIKVKHRPKQMLSFEEVKKSWSLPLALFLLAQPLLGPIPSEGSGERRPHLNCPHRPHSSSEMEASGQI